MCDQANHDNCEILDDLHLVITNLEMDISGLIKEKLELQETIADLKSEVKEDLKTLDNMDFLDYNDYDPIIEKLVDKWEAK